MNDKKREQRTKRQHWLPRASYLKNFTVRGKIKVYQFIDDDKADFIHTAKQFDVSPTNIALKKNLYEAPMVPDNTIEKIFAEIEGRYGQVLENKIKKGKELTENEHEKVATYVNALENRTILQQTHLNSFIDKLDKTGRGVAMGHNAPEAADRWSDKMSAAKEVFFAQGIAVSLEINKWSPLDFCFLIPAGYVKEAEFITSDHPVTVVDFTANNSIYGLNQWGKTAECVVPLTPKIALFGNRCGVTGYKAIDHNFVREINNRVLRRADKMVMTAQPIPEYEGKAMVRRVPQSLLLKFIKLPTGRADRIIKAQKERELSEQDNSNQKNDRA